MNTQQFSEDYNNTDLFNRLWKDNEKLCKCIEDFDAVATEIIKLCGYGRVLDIGCGKGELVRHLLQRGLDTYGLDISDYVINTYSQDLDVFKIGSINNLNWDNSFFNTVVCCGVLEFLSEEELAVAIEQIFNVTQKFLYIKVFINNDNESRYPLMLKKRKWWEERFFNAGFRKHTLLLNYLSYESLEHEEGYITLVFEKIPLEANKKYPIESLLNEKDLHNDMLRQSGRRSDAHIIRYINSLKYIRPNDVVLDVACGLGYGSAILWDGSKARSIIALDDSSFSIDYANNHYSIERSGLTFRKADAHSLKFLDDSSIDIVISMETVEHLKNPDIFFNEVQRVLRPGGRFILSVPNEWIDDPNPHHLHVFNKKSLENKLKKNFIPEIFYGQTAGGGFKLTNSTREWFSFDENNQDKDSEWLIAVAIKNPIDNTHGYKETVHWEADKVKSFHPHHYKNYYQYPEIQHVLVTMGFRVTQTKAVQEISANLMKEVDITSSDYGAILCINGYRLLEKMIVTSDELNQVIDKLNKYTSQNLDSPMKARWIISCFYLLGQLYLKIGNKINSIEAFQKCLDIDFIMFSPSLATKTVSAAIKLGELYLIQNNIDLARSYWKRALNEAVKAFKVNWEDWWGDIEIPLSFEMKEASQLLDLASLASHALVLTRDKQLIRHSLLQEIQDFSIQYQLKWLKKREESLEKNIIKIIKENKNIQSELVLEQADMILENKQWIGQLEEGKSWLENKVLELELILKEKDYVVNEFINYNSDLLEAKKWNEAKIFELESLIINKEESIKILSKHVADLIEENNNLKSKVESLE